MKKKKHEALNHDEIKKLYEETYKELEPLNNELFLTVLAMGDGLFGSEDDPRGYKHEIEDFINILMKQGNISELNNKHKQLIIWHNINISNFIGLQQLINAFFHKYKESLNKLLNILGKTLPKSDITLKHGIYKIQTKKVIKIDKKETLEQIIEYFSSNDVLIKKKGKTGNREGTYLMRSGFTAFIVKIDRPSGIAYSWHIRDNSTQKIIAKGTSLTKFKSTAEAIFY